jgi:hypothetical protein
MQAGRRGCRRIRAGPLAVTTGRLRQLVAGPGYHMAGQGCPVDAIIRMLAESDRVRNDYQNKIARDAY